MISWWFRTLVKATREVAKSPEIPRWLRGLVGIGLLPIPIIPIDEAALVLAGLILYTYYRHVLIEAWNAHA